MKSSSRHILWERSAISLKDMSDIFLSAGDENGGIRREDRLGRDIEVDVVACFYAEDVQVMPAADIKLDDAFPFPCFWYEYFVDGVFVAEREVVKDMIGTAADGRPKRELALRVDGFVRAVPQQEFFVNVARGARYDIACAKFFEKRGCFEGALEVIADGDDADIKVGDVERAQKVGIGAVGDECVRHERQNAVYAVFVVVDGEDRVLHVVQLFCNVAAEAAKSDEQDGFHDVPPIRW